MKEATIKSRIRRLLHDFARFGYALDSAEMSDKELKVKYSATNPEEALASLEQMIDRDNRLRLPGAVIKNKALVKFYLGMIVVHYGTIVADLIEEYEKYYRKTAFKELLDSIDTRLFETHCTYLTEKSYELPKEILVDGELTNKAAYAQTLCALHGKVTEMKPDIEVNYKTFCKWANNHYDVDVTESTFHQSQWKGKITAFKTFQQIIYAIKESPANS